MKDKNPDYWMKKQIEYNRTYRSKHREEFNKRARMYYQRKKREKGEKMAKIRPSSKAVCPFYLGVENRRIHHEELPSKAKVIISFETNDKMKEHEETYCNCMTNYENCPIAKAMADLYGGFDS
jgi:hypothetical protein